MKLLADVAKLGADGTITRYNQQQRAAPGA
jgi:hypothetical protein